ncbi:hypothetical protein [Pseudoflavitalea rhizosphaerae]|uniref:hypothetical protein n=1 Tax=Pseudoflavitalea rhizosphaerae TaxID=1884793 RepID=UPI0013DEF169|nr:hypothetical protein [Pseudoflavitalea rhizosphaerae]
MNLNFFNNSSPLFQFRWFIIAILIAVGTLIYFDVTGRRIFAPSSGSQQWSSSGPGYHK